VLYFMPDSLMNNCRDSMNEQVFYNIQRFQYDCPNDFGGPCLWLSDFYTTCIAPLDMDSLSTHDTCMLEGVADHCETDVREKDIHILNFSNVKIPHPKNK
jgi:hypothetical protein